jgi:putative DNA primase/helicase
MNTLEELEQAATAPVGPPPPPLTGLNLALIEYKQLLTLELPERKRHLPWLPEGGNVMVYAMRGVGKTYFLLGLAASLVTGTPFLKWPTHEAVGVLYVDGEMQLDELRQRITALLPCPPKRPLHFLSSEMVYHTLHRDLVLTSEVVRDEIIGILDAHPDIRVVILDNVSCLFAGIDEDKKRDWEPIAAWLIRLRHRGLATVLVHHAGKGGEQRGTSGREDALDTVIHLAHPSTYEADEGCHFELTFEKSRSVKGKEVEPLDVTLSEQHGQLAWEHKFLEVSRLDQVRALLAEGLTSNADIAEALGISRSYAWKLKRKIEKGGTV